MFCNSSRPTSSSPFCLQHLGSSIDQISLTGHASWMKLALYTRTYILMLLNKCSGQTSLQQHFVLTTNAPCLLCNHQDGHWIEQCLIIQYMPISWPQWDADVRGHLFACPIGFTLITSMPSTSWYVDPGIAARFNTGFLADTHQLKYCLMRTRNMETT